MEENKHYTGDIKAENLSQLLLKVFQALFVFASFILRFTVLREEVGEAGNA